MSSAIIKFGDAPRELLFEKPTFAISTEETRYYLNGTALFVTGSVAIAVATDGHRMVRSTAAVEVTGDWSPSGLIVPRPAVETIAALKANCIVTDGKIIEVTGDGFVFSSKLIDGAFPDWKRLIPEKSRNTLEVDRAEMLGVLKRLTIVADSDAEKKKGHACGLVWTSGKNELTLCLTQSDAAEDTIAAAVSCEGDGYTAGALRYFTDILENLNGDRVLFDSADPGSVIRIAAPDDESLLCILMPMRWFLQQFPQTQETPPETPAQTQAVTP